MVKRVQRTQIYRGFSSQNNNKNVLYDIALVNQDIINHFNTRKGERVMYPNFGSVIWDVIYDPFTEALRDLIIEDTKNIIAAETRVDLKNIIIDQFEHGIVIQLELEYKPFAVIDTFQLQFDRRASERAANADR